MTDPDPNPWPSLILEEMKRQGITQSEMERRLVLSSKHINRVLSSKSGTAELNYWAYALGVQWATTYRETP